MDKSRIAIYDCYVPLNDEVKKIHFDKIAEMEKELLEDPENEIVGKFFDNCSSTTPLEERPEFQKVSLQAHAGQVDMVVSINMKNFSRNIQDALRVIVELDNKGVILKSHDGEFDSRHMDKVENLEFSRILDMSEFLEEDQELDGGMVMQ